MKDYQVYLKSDAAMAGLGERGEAWYTVQRDLFVGALHACLQSQQTDFVFYGALLQG